MQQEAEILELTGERFTLWIGSNGKPVERSLAEMRAGEILAAIRWHDEECKRLTCGPAQGMSLVERPVAALEALSDAEAIDEDLRGNGVGQQHRGKPRVRCRYGEVSTAGEARPGGHAEGATLDAIFERRAAILATAMNGSLLTYGRCEPRPGERCVAVWELQGGDR